MLGGAGAATTYQDIVLADNPDYYWTFDEASGNTSNLGSLGSGGGGNDLVPGGSEVRGPSTNNAGGLSLGNGAFFPNTGGAASEMWVAGGLSDGGYTQYIIEFWFRDDAPAKAAEYLWDHSVPGLPYGNDPAAIVGFDIAGTQANFEVFSGTRTGTDGPDVSDGSWHHMVVGIDSTAGHYIYLDGALHSHQPETISDWGGGQSLTIGGNRFAGGSNQLTGAIDEFAIYGTTTAELAAKTAAVAAHFNAIPEPTAGLLLGLGACVALRRRRLG